MRQITTLWGSSCRTLALFAICFLLATSNSLPSKEPVTFEAMNPQWKFVPQNLMKLIHTPEVQHELGIEGERLAELEVKLLELDGPWWRSRLKPEDAQRKIVSELEAQLIDHLKSTLASEKLKRLKEIELHSQGTRIFARPDIATTIGLTKSQVARLNDLFADTDRIAKRTKPGQANDPKVLAEIQSAREAEAKGIGEILTAKQKAAFGALLGEPFDTTKLQRVYPLAPELIDSGEWVGSSPTLLSDHRGRVVLLHFYAFQCSNCIANFEHYKRWHEKWSNRGVSVIGIQTPETPAERDVNQVRKAAKDKGFEFPVLIDTRNSNWDAWANTMWPTVYVVDKNGYIRYLWQGELNWQGATGDKTIEQLVEKLLAE